MAEKKYGYVRCSICGKRVRYKVDPKYVNAQPNRLIAIRRHWSRQHPRAWREAIERGVRKRLARLRR